ncbi:WD40/YVTN/BNR-like repeat-containing protein [Longimicrobium sp.]|uniref:WD40/YVTN/BNR-like repeat-containing protein n=1 Tax=Longimicrobium sp. TaxID=2029185 RepID=UPI003B3A2A83
MRRLFMAVTLCALSACGVADSPTLATPEAPPSREVQHASTTGYPGFYFYNGIIPGDSALGTFDPNVSPTVRVCRITNGVCGSNLGTASRTSPWWGNRYVTVNTSEERYQVDWPTASVNAQTGQIYRVSVSVGTRTLGFMDVKMVGSWFEFFTTDTNDYIPWFAGSTLPVYFRIETGVPGSITVSAASINLNVGASVSVSSVLRDLRGQPMADTALWWMDNPDVAQLDSGWVVAKTPGTTILWAWYYDIEVQIPITVTDTRRAWNTMTTGTDQGNRGIWGTSASNVYAANYTGLLRWNGTAWAYVPELQWRTLHDVWGSSASDVWAVGEKGEMVRWNGTAWTLHRYDGTSVTQQPLGNFDTPAQSYALRGVWGSSATNVFAVGDGGVVLRYDGTTWTRMTTGTTAQLNRVWGSSATNVYAVTSTGRLLRYNGTAWSFVAGVQAPGALWSVWGSSASNVYAVGDGGIVFRYNGTSWSRVRLPRRDVLYGVWGSGASNVYVGGGAGVLYRFDGTNWIPEKALNGQSHIQALWGTSSGADLFASAAGGRVFKR